MKISSNIENVNGENKVVNSLINIIEPDLKKESLQFIDIIQAYDDFTIHGFQNWFTYKLRPYLSINII